MRFRNSLKIGLLLTTLLLAANARTAVAGMVTYDVSISTAGFSGMDGYLDIQLGTAGDNVPIQVMINNFSTDGTIAGATDDLSNGTASISGSFPSTVTLINDDTGGQSAYASQFFSAFNNVITFSVTFDSDGIGAASPSSPSLAISLFGSAPDFLPYFSGPIGENNAAAFFLINTDGTITTTTYAGVAPYNDPAPTVTLQSVPEPATISLLASGVVLGVLNRICRFPKSRNGLLCFRRN